MFGQRTPNGADRRIWLAKIEAAFGTRPRDGNVRGSVWLKRERYENTLHDLLATETPHVCVDGPTGTGKTSLVVTQLHRVGRPYVYVQVARTMNWAEFCRELVLRPDGATKDKGGGEFELSFGFLGSGVKYRRSLGASSSTSFKELKERAAAWSTHDVAAMLAQESTTLVIDDFEKAHGSEPTALLQRVSDLCKILTGQHKGKVVVVGTGSIYLNLMETDRALEGRIRQLSVPTLERRTDGWEILRQGFSKLGFDNPAQRASKYPRDQRFKQDLEESVTAAFRAADGLPKHINELGSRICQNSIGRISASRVRTSISKADIEKSSREMLQEHYGHVKDKFPKIRRIVEKHVEIRLVLQAVYGMGVNTIHHFDSLCERVKGDLDEEAVRFALDKLVELDLFSRTGRSGEVIFANDPTLMHTLGVVCSAPQEFGESAERFGFLGQLSLPFPVHQTA